MVEAEVMYQRALDGYERALGPDHIFTLNTVYALGLLYMSDTVSKTKEAVPLVARALHGYEMAMGPSFEWTLEAASTLVDLYQMEGRIEEADLISERYLTVKS